MPRLKAITQPLPLAKMAYERLRDSILVGQLRGGEVYNEMSLAKELGISRTPVREALLELSAQDLVTFLPRKGVLIKHYNQRDVEEIFEIRRIIELAAIEKVAKALPAVDFSGIEKALSQQRRAARKKDYIVFLKADRKFHTIYFELTRNRRLVAMMGNIRDMIQAMGIEGLSKTGRAETVIQEHEQVFEALRQGNIDKAKTAMRYHLDRSEEVVLEVYKTQNHR